MTAQPSPLSRYPRALRTLALLAVLYLGSSSVHLYVLRNSFRIPETSSDEVKFVATGENIRLGRGYERRGFLNSTDPPVFPVFIAMAHSIGPDPRVAMFVLSTFLMCSVLFPAYALGKVLGLDTPTAAVLAAAASVLPHTFYAASYMTEIVQYPAYLTAFYLAVRWLEKPGWRWDLALSFAMGLLTLTKEQGNVFVVAFVVALAVIALHSLRTGTSAVRNLIQHAGAVLLVAAVMEGSWFLYKWTHGGTAIGAYQELLSTSAFPYLTPALTTAYFLDFLLAPGLITAVLLFYWVRHNGNYPRTVLVLSFLVVLVVAISVKEGGQTGWLRERLFLYALPVTAILAAAGLAHFKKRQTFLAGFAFLALPLLLAGALAVVYPFPVSSIIEVPWANALGTLAGTVPFSRLWLIVAVLGLSVLIASLLLRISRGAPLLFSGYILLFFGLGFFCSSAGLDGWAAQGSRTVSPVLDWLSANQIHSGDRLLIVGEYSEYSNPPGQDGSLDQKFADWNRRIGLTDPLQWQIETIGRFDVRKIQTPARLTLESRPGDYLLTATAFDSFELKSFRYPLYLYRVNAAVTRAPLPKYATHIPADRFLTLTGGRDSSGAIVGTGGQTSGYLVYGPQLDLPPGNYSIKFDVADSASKPLSFDVAVKGGRRILARISAVPAQLGPIPFVKDSSRQLEFRVFGASDPTFRFDGVDLEWLSGTAQPGTPRQSAGANGPAEPSRP